MGDKRRGSMVKKTEMRTFQVIGRGQAISKNSVPQLFRMKLFAQNEVVAKSRFWYFLSQINKVKKATGEVVAVNEVFEKKPNTIKNYGIVLRYNSRSGTHNMYKEFRDTTLNGAVDQLYLDMAGRHRARKRSVYVIKAEPIPAKDCKKDSTKFFHDDKLAFPLPHKAVAPSKKNRTLYATARPCTHTG